MSNRLSVRLIEQLATVPVTDF